jgi:hypothetical protein
MAQPLQIVIPSVKQKRKDVLCLILIHAHPDSVPQCDMVPQAQELKTATLSATFTTRKNLTVWALHTTRPQIAPIQLTATMQKA